ncbi:MAG TPA: riboflavin synthase [Bdellovibrionota bacterium]|nr:riboflavin synthase [Bdellovibrionota bacterium]
MFTGIIQEVGTVLSVTPRPEAQVVRLATGYSDLESGESVAVNGVCLTVTTKDDSRGEAEFFISRETLARSNLGALREGTKVNLERALRLDSRLSGHIVQGHVDGIARFVSASRPAKEDASYEIELDLEPAQGRYLIEKGSVALNGVSLTVNTVEKGASRVRAGITLIPHTWNHTNLSELKPGDPLNVEVDVLAKYVESLCQRAN